ncbi:DUF2268 domain-containing putative Zn-dependent protease [Exiguobacterium artemiae]|uniref:DUF2268 domain-containing putative Zn-dependent protease n=1 Tax=Exiguobacterium artemiae TaxID=340145 RepID=UPI002965375E|nr:DUF2268 domain-containing putative Zn-dependent protease [Exiguobacterium sibiricum]MDW2885919.1 DUF2268 domain-containing putative Zn-dependent protease [Exiguobacterium sibiricum]
MKRFLLAATLTGLLAGCSDAPEAEKAEPQKLTFKQDHQTIQIIPLYDAYQSYVDATLKEPTENGALFEKHVMAAKNKWIEKEKLTDTYTDRRILEIPTDNAEELNKTIAYLKKHQDAIQQQIKKSLQTSIQKLPRTDKLTVFVAPYDVHDAAEIKRHGGVNGFASGTDMFTLYLAKDFSKDTLANAVAHEYHHTVAFESNTHDSIFNSIMLEGEADMFAAQVYPKGKSEATEPLLDHTLENLLTQINNHNVDAYDLRYGNYDKDIPPLAQYTLGFMIMTDFIQKNSDVPVAKWTQMPPADILEKTDYAKKLTIR